MTDFNPYRFALPGVGASGGTVPFNAIIDDFDNSAIIDDFDNGFILEDQ